MAPDCSGVDLGVRDRRGIGADGLARNCQNSPGGMRSLMPDEVGRRRTVLSGFRLTWRAPKHGRDDLDAELVARHLDELAADVALERLLEVVGVGRDGGRHERPRRDLLLMSAGARLHISRLPRWSATSSVPRLNSVLPQNGSNS